MNEKTKQILRYVACGLGGLALGISLLGGLSMCATSGNKQTEDVNTILTKKNALIGTDQGNYTGYKLEIPSRGSSLYAYSEMGSNCISSVYEIDTTTYTPTLLAQDSEPRLIENGVSQINNTIANIVTTWTPTTSGKTYFLIVEGQSLLWTGAVRNWQYFTFLMKEALTGQGLTGFVLSNWAFTQAYKLGTTSLVWRTNSSSPILLTAEQTQYWGYLTNAYPSTFSYQFQDVASYYQELGYQDGYDNGHDTGFDDGYADGYDFGYSEGHTAGYSEGHTAGYSEGYDDAYAEKDSGIAFTSCGVFPNAHVTLQTDETIGNFNYMYLCHYITKPGYDEHTIYILWTRNANTGQYLGEVIDRNDSDSYDPAVTLGSFSQEITPSVTITANEDMEFGLWVGYITTFHNRGEVTNSILWFQGGTAESDMQIYQNGYDEGYQNGNQQGQETGYEEGYDRGHEVGDAEGYSRGYTEGFNQTNTKNVFSLFTSAFDSVASFFDLKIFGFLPLYWFFLAPLFIALISLLMRMVKH